MQVDRKANGHRRREVVSWLRKQELPCHICELDIDYSLPAGNPLCFECDELVPVSLGGSPIQRDNVGPAHRCCNEWRGNRMKWNPAKAPTRCRETGIRYGLVMGFGSGIEHSHDW